KNDGAQATLDAGKIARDLHRHIVRTGYATRIAKAHGIDVAPECWRYGLYNLGMRVASLRLASAQHPIPHDTTLKCMRDVARSLYRGQGYSPLHRIALTVWVLGVAIAPPRVAEMLVSWRYALNSRPRAVQWLLTSA